MFVRGSSCVRRETRARKRRDERVSKENEREGVETEREGTEKTGAHSKRVVRERTRVKGGGEC